MKNLIVATALMLPLTIAAESKPEAAEAAADLQQMGITVMGDQDAPLGLFLAPWKEETRADVLQAPGVHDQPATALRAEGYARATQYYAVGRAYRSERLMRNH